MESSVEIFLSLAVVFILIALWSLKSVCAYFDTSYASYKRASLALVIALAITVLIDFVLLSYFSFWVGFALSVFFYLLLPTYVYSQVFVLSVGKGLLTHVASSALTLMLFLLILLALLFSGFFSGLGVGARSELSITGLLDLPHTIKSYVVLSKIQKAAQTLCGCIEDNACVFTQRSKLDSLLAENDPASYSQEQRDKLKNINQLTADCMANYHVLIQQREAWKKTTKTPSPPPTKP